MSDDNRPVMTEEEIDALLDVPDILSKDEIDSLLDIVPFAEYMTYFVSRLLLYSMLAKENGLIFIMSELEHERNPIVKELLEMAVDANEIEDIKDRASKIIKENNFEHEDEQKLFNTNVKAILITIQCIYENKKLSTTALALEKLL